MTTTTTTTTTPSTPPSASDLAYTATLRQIQVDAMSAAVARVIVAGSVPAARAAHPVDAAMIVHLTRQLVWALTTSEEPDSLLVAMLLLTDAVRSAS